MNSASHNISDSSDDETDIGESRMQKVRENKSLIAANSTDKEGKVLEGLVDNPDEWDIVKENGPLTTEDLTGNKELYLIRMPLGMVDPMHLIDVDIKDEEESQIKKIEVNSEMYEAVFYNCGKFQPSLFLPKDNGTLHHIQEKLKGQILLQKGLNTSSRVPVIDIEALKSVIHSPPSDLKTRPFLQYEADTTKRLGGAVKIEQTNESQSSEVKKKKKKAKEKIKLNGNAGSNESTFQNEKKDEELRVESVSKEKSPKKKKKRKEMEATISTNSASESPVRKEREESCVDGVGMFEGDLPKKKKKKKKTDSLNSTEETPVISGIKEQNLDVDSMEIKSSKKKKKENMQSDMKRDSHQMESPKKKDKQKQSDTSIVLESQELPNGKKKKKKKRQQEDCASDVDLFPDDKPPKKKKKKENVDKFQAESLNVTVELGSMLLPKKVKTKKKEKRAKEYH
ncbi:uncharacterized protein LOC143038614 [Oratosquilla oratoria]|uniref:uncharacterized protein LOC143038614 n=1 Tax=Oratosquilla oratoria TaxID=337810 RepID=UPI003F76DFF5